MEFVPLLATLLKGRMAGATLHAKHAIKKLKFRMSLLHVCIHRYKLEIKVEDKNNANFIFWDDQCFKFIEKSVADQIQLMKDEGEDDLKVYLDPLDKMLECTLAMRIRMQPKVKSFFCNVCLLTPTSLNP
ncbi:hypothetical protein AAZX31_09G026600 [Glycine max]